jgi:hypothetical protein
MVMGNMVYNLNVNIFFHISYTLNFFNPGILSWIAALRWQQFSLCHQQLSAAKRKLKFGGGVSGKVISRLLRIVTFNAQAQPFSYKTCFF